MFQVPNKKEITEQRVAFTLIDYESLLQDLLIEKTISKDEHDQMHKSIDLILNRCGLI